MVTEHDNLAPSVKTTWVEENIMEKLHDIGLGNNFLYMTPKATKAKIGKWDNIKLKNFCTSKGTIKGVKGNVWIGKKYEVRIIYLKRH